MSLLTTDSLIDSLSGVEGSKSTKRSNAKIMPMPAMTKLFLFTIFPYNFAQKLFSDSKNICVIVINMSFRKINTELKKGIALLITIALIAAITALIGVAGGIIDESFKRISNKQFLIQSNSLFSGFKEILKNASGDVNDSMTLDIFLSMPFVFDLKSRDISVDISFTSAAQSINPNLMLKSAENNATQNESDVPVPINESYEAYFDRILTVYNVSDKILLLSMIADTVDGDLKERITGSEIALEDPFFSQGHIYSIDHFYKILEAYKRQTLDYNVDQIPWEHLLSFTNETVDLNHIEQDTLSMLMPDMDAASLASLTTDRVDVYESFESMGMDSESAKTLQSLGVGFYSPEVKAWINIRNGEEHQGLTFLYNLQTKKARHIEITN